MPRRLPALLTLAVVLAVAVSLLLTPGRALAHNSLESSDPADGATLSTAPATMLLRFANAVPLDTLTVTLIDPTGARADLAGAAHGAEEREVVVPLPVLANGAHTLRWRLVGADGHAVTGRVDFTIALTPSSTPSTTAPPTTAPDPDPTAAEQDAGEPEQTPAAIGWLIRVAAYLALVVAVGAMAIHGLLDGAGRAATVLRLTAQRAVLAVGVASALQLLVLAADVGGVAPWSAWSWLDAATATNPGKALVARFALCAAALAILGPGRPVHRDLEHTTLGFLALAAWTTWAFTGHAGNRGSAWLGVPLDVAHHGAATVWLGGLAGLAWLSRKPRSDADLAEPARRFSRVAATAVAVLVVTGVAQTLRLHEGLPDLGTAHGRLLAAKVAALAVLLVVANGNRRRVAGPFPAAALHRALLTELALGVAIIGATAALVVSSPG